MEKYLWIPYYINKANISLASSQIKPGTLSNYKKIIGKSRGAGANVKLGISGFLSRLFKADANLEGKVSKNDTEEVEYSYEELDQKTKNFLIYAENNHKILDETSTNKSLSQIGRENLIKFSGLFTADIQGDSYSQRLANYLDAEHIQWIGNCGKVKVSFYTGTSSLISKTFIHPVISSKRGKIHFDGFGAFQKSTTNHIALSPIFIGIQLTKKGEEK